MKRTIVLALLLSSPAFAQQQTLNERIGAQIGALLIQNAGLQMELEQAQALLRSANDRLKAVEDQKGRESCVPKDTH
jgi:hypothetical protein